MTALPSHWEVQPLAGVADVRLGRQRSPKNHSGTHMRPYLRAANVDWIGLKLDDVKEMNFTDAEMQVYRLERGDIILGEASGSAGEVGKPALWNNEIEECAFQNTLLRVRSQGPEPRYLLHWLRYLARSGQFAAQSRGVGIHHIGKAKLAEWPVPLPPIHEQRRIVDSLEGRLSRLDAAGNSLHDARRRAEALAFAHRHSLFADAAGETTTLGRVARWGSGGTPRARAPEYYKGGAIPWVVSGDLRDMPLGPVPGRITEAGLGASSAKWVPSNAVLVAMYGATIGRAATTNEPVTTNQAVAHAVPIDALTTADYLFWFLLSQRRQLVRAGKGGAQPNISQTVLKAWPMRLPPLETQAAVVRQAVESATVLHRLDEAIVLAERRQISLRRALLDAAFSGRLTGASRDAACVEELASV